MSANIKLPLYNYDGDKPVRITKAEALRWVVRAREDLQLIASMLRHPELFDADRFERLAEDAAGSACEVQNMATATKAML